MGGRHFKRPSNLQSISHSMAYKGKMGTYLFGPSSILDTTIQGISEGYE